MSEMGADFERKAESNGSRARRGKRRGASVSEPPGPTAPTSNSTNRMIPRKRLQEYCPLPLDQEVRVELGTIWTVIRRCTPFSEINWNRLLEQLCKLVQLLRLLRSDRSVGMAQLASVQLGQFLGGLGLFVSS